MQNSFADTWAQCKRVTAAFGLGSPTMRRPFKSSAERLSHAIALAGTRVKIATLSATVAASAVALSDTMFPSAAMFLKVCFRNRFCFRGCPRLCECESTSPFPISAPGTPCWQCDCEQEWNPANPTGIRGFCRELLCGSDNDCKNGGKCQQSVSGSSFYKSCVCPFGFTGDLCQDKSSFLNAVRCSGKRLFWVWER